MQSKQALLWRSCALPLPERICRPLSGGLAGRQQRFRLLKPLASDTEACRTDIAESRQAVGLPLSKSASVFPGREILQPLRSTAFPRPSGTQQRSDYRESLVGRPSRRSRRRNAPPLLDVGADAENLPLSGRRVTSGDQTGRSYAAARLL